MGTHDLNKPKDNKNKPELHNCRTDLVQEYKQTPISHQL